MNDLRRKNYHKEGADQLRRNPGRRVGEYLRLFERGLSGMKRDAWYRFTFEDGFCVICTSLNAMKSAEYRKMHGNITNKEFVAWDNDLTINHIVGGD